MTTAYTSLLGLALPVTGELSGTWGDTVNNSITSLLDSAIAGTTTLSADTTLTTTTGASNQARQAILLCTGHSANITITAPAQSKIYTVINASATYTVKIRGVGPTTGITIPVSSTATVAWNGSDFVDASGYINGNLKVNGTLTVAGTATIGGNTAVTGTLSATGAITSTQSAADTSAIAVVATAATRTKVFGATGSTTAGMYGLLTNTGGGMLFGVENSGGGNIVTGSGAYSAYFGTNTNTPVSIAVNSAQVGVFDTSGNLGLGVTPSAWGSGLKAVELGGSNSYFALNNTAASGYVYWNMWNDGTNNKTKQTGYIGAYGLNTSGQHVWFNGTGTTGATSSLTQAMTLDASGNLLVGGSASAVSSTKLQVQNSNIAIYRDDGVRNVLTFIKDSGTTQTWNTQLKADANQNYYMISNPAETVGVYMTPGASGWNNLSDERFKTNWVELTNALSGVMSLRAGTFNWVKDPTLPRDVGVIAQDVLQVLPEAVNTIDPDELGVRYTHLVPMLIKAIQEQQALITQLTARITALEGA